MSGSTFVARRAGKYPARSPVSASTATARTIVVGSFVAKPKSMDETSRDAAHAAGRPNTLRLVRACAWRRASPAPALATAVPRERDGCLSRSCVGPRCRPARRRGRRLPTSARAHRRRSPRSPSIVLERDCFQAGTSAFRSSRACQPVSAEPQRESPMPPARANRRRRSRASPRTPFRPGMCTPDRPSAAAFAASPRTPHL